MGRGLTKVTKEKVELLLRCNEEISVRFHINSKVEPDKCETEMLLYKLGEEHEFDMITKTLKGFSGASSIGCAIETDELEEYEKNLVLTIKNPYGEFELTMGETYDFDLVDVESGEPYPVDGAKVLGIDENGLKVRFKDSREAEYIPTDIIVHEQLSKD